VFAASFGEKNNKIKIMFVRLFNKMVIAYVRDKPIHVETFIPREFIDVENRELTFHGIKIPKMSLLYYL
jgi:hypothetical protein